MKNFSIKQKLLLVSLPVLGLLLFFSGYTIMHEKKILMDQARDAGHMINSYLAGICLGAMKNYDYDLIQSYLVESAENDMIAFSTVYDAKNAVVATTRDKQNSDTVFTEENGIMHPIVSRRLGELGRVETVLSFRKVNEQIWQVTLNYALFFTIVLCMVVVAAVRGGRSITRPIYLLLDGIEKVRRGDLDSPVEIVSRDETGLVGQAFNEMQEKLKNTLSELQRHRQGLEVLVERRTAELEKSNSELQEAQEELLSQKDAIERNNDKLVEAFKQLRQTQSTIVQQEKMASVGQLAAGVAHEINNPMGYIMSNMSTMAKYIDRLKEFDDRQSGMGLSACSLETLEDLRSVRKKLKVDYIFADMPELIKESLDGAERVKEIVQNLKSFSRVDEAECKPANINECLESTLKIVWNELKYKCKVIKEYGELPLTLCSAQKLNQVFVNLLVNASHAIEKQGEITIKTWGANNNIYVAITDTGCGIPEENLHRVFEPFFTTKEVGKGTGLGLSIVYDIVTKNHQGEIMVASEPGKGTTFTVVLPVKE